MSELQAWLIDPRFEGSDKANWVKQFAVGAPPFVEVGHVLWDTGDLPSEVQGNMPYQGMIDLTDQTPDGREASGVEDPPTLSEWDVRQLSIYNALRCSCGSERSPEECCG